MGAPLGEMTMLDKSSQSWQGNFVLTQPKSFTLSERMGMRTSLLEKHASLEGELYSQDENVAEADKVNLNKRNGESETPIFREPPTIAKRWGDLQEICAVFSSCPATRTFTYESSDTGIHEVLVNSCIGLKPGRPG